MISEKEKKFLLVFFASFAALYLAVQLLPINFFLNWLAGTEAELLKFLGVQATAGQALVFTPTAEFEIIRDCSGLVMVALLAALLLATGSKKIFGTLALFAPLLVIFNVFRLLATLFVGARFGSAALEAAHFSFWIADTALVLLIWAHGEGLLEKSPELFRA